MADTRQRFQGKCFLSSEGHQWMERYYDHMPPDVRRRLMDSPFNLCAACVHGRSYNNKNVKDYYNAIDEMEAAILAELGPFGPQPVNPAPLVVRPRRRHHGAKAADHPVMLDLPQANPDQAKRVG